jgi:hypothetical protein
MLPPAGSPDVITDFGDLRFGPRRLSDATRILVVIPNLTNSISPRYHQSKEQRHVSATLTARQNVAGYASWRAVYDSVDDLRNAHGCTGQQVLRLPADHNVVFITHSFPTVEQAQAFADDPKLHEAMQRAGVTSTPNLEIFETIS